MPRRKRALPTTNSLGIQTVETQHTNMVKQITAVFQKTVCIFCESLTVGHACFATRITLVGSLARLAAPRQQVLGLAGVPCSWLSPPFWPFFAASL